MLVNIRKKILIWTPYKNYSTSLHRHLRGNKGWMMVVGGHTLMPEMFGPHSNQYPGPCEDELTRILPLRDPFDRVVSMYRFNQRRKAEGDRLAFDEWFDTRAMEPLNGPAASQYKHDAVVRCENIQDELGELGVDMTEFPWHNRSEDASEITLTRRQREIIAWFHAADFEARERGK